jgi:beta-galactosidase/beta-glucuronidase
LLHFGAVDWRTEVFINGVKIGSHEGGYDPFTFDITDALKKGTQQQIDICVWDPTDKGPQPRGKQVVNPRGIWYTSVTGIWQTVWLEVVPETFIESTRQTPDVDNHQLTITANVQNMQSGDEIRFTALKGNEVVAEKTGSNTTEILSISNPKLWSPSDPFLYDLKVAVIRKGKIIDEVKSYFAMRKISIAADNNGIQRMMLNDHFLFEFGPLDQGWWPDGLYTAATDAAMKNDIQTIKEMGCNMIRKHVKVEPARWYYYCDQMGMLVWQDMPSGDLGNHWESHPGILGNQTDKDRTPESETIYKKEWNAIMNTLYNFPCIVVWIPFNEAWGQFKTTEIVQQTMQNDPTRLVNSASGGNYYDVGQIIDLHNYPDPAMPKPELFGKTRAIVLGEFGGLGLPLDGHTWQQKSWGYQSFSTNDSLFRRYSSMIDRLKEFIPIGLSAAVYTQTTDVEGEVNGFMTYDRKVLKMPLEKLRAVNKSLYDIFKE